MGRQVVRDTQSGFAGGLNLTSDPAFLRPDQARQMANFRLSIFGAALKRLGSILTTSTAITTFDTTGSVGGGIYWGSTAYLIGAATGSTALHLYSASPVVLPVTWTDLGAISQYRPVIFSDGTNEVLYVAGDSSAFVNKVTSGGVISSLAGTTAKVDGLCVYNDRLWGWKGNTLYYSNLSSAQGSTGGDSLGDTAAGGGAIIVRTFSASDIIACAAVNGSLLIWHRRGVSVLTGWGQDDVEVQPQALTSDVGMGVGTLDGIATASELSTGDTAYFASPFGIYVTNGGSIRPLGTPDRPDPIATILAVGQTKMTDVVLRYNRQYNELWVTLKGGSAPGTYIYNVILGAWSGPFDGPYASSGFRALFEVLNIQQMPKLWLANFSGPGGTGLFVAECDRASVYRDSVLPAGTGGTAVTATLQLHRFFCGDRSYAKSYRWLNVLATLASGMAAPTLSYTNSVNGSGTLTFTNLASVEKTYYLSPGGSGVWLDATITDANTTTTSQYATVDVQAYFLGQR